MVPIPTNRPMVSASTSPTSSTRPRTAKFDAVVDDIVERHEQGQPVLVGTVQRREDASYLSRHARKKRGVPHDGPEREDTTREEATIVAQAGPQGRRHRRHQHGRPWHRHHARAATPSSSPTRELRNQGLEPASRHADEYESRLADDGREGQGAGRRRARRGRASSAACTSLGTERHESRRIDNQLRGRSGRQGDPGESAFYLSLQDDLMRLFNVRRGSTACCTVLKIPDDVPIENEASSPARIATAQGQVESRNFEIPQERPQVRRRHGPPAQGHLRRAAPGARGRGPAGADPHLPRRRRRRRTSPAPLPRASPRSGTSTQLWTALAPDLPGLRQPRRRRSSRRPAATVGHIDREELIETLKADAHAALPGARGRGRRGGHRASSSAACCCSVLDRKWREHLYEMDYLREGIDLRAYSQRDPLVEYQREGFDMFAAMMDGIKEEAVGFLFNLEVSGRGGGRGRGGRGGGRRGRSCSPRARSTSVPPSSPPSSAKGLERPSHPQNLTYSAPAEDGEAEVRGTTVSNADDEYAGVGRNDRCPCGSGKKFKRCTALRAVPPGSPPAPPADRRSSSRRARLRNEVADDVSRRSKPTVGRNPRGLRPICRSPISTRGRGRSSAARLLNLLDPTERARSSPLLVKQTPARCRPSEARDRAGPA